jgi:hypothetical protein
MRDARAGGRVGGGPAGRCARQPGSADARARGARGRCCCAASHVRPAAADTVRACVPRAACARLCMQQALAAAVHGRHVAACPTPEPRR